jgi:uncharacterized protein with HEPN domain
MSPRSWKERIEDILEAIAEIKAFTQSMDLDKFREDARTLKAVALNFVVIGEAAARIPEDVANGHPEIAWNLIRGMRNRLVHDYFSIDAEIVWDTLTNDLPPLVEPLRKLLEST